MASIQEVEITADTARLTIDGTEYSLFAFGASKKWLTVVAGRWNHDRRSLGKTFHNAADLIANYKRHGQILYGYAVRICPNLPGGYRVNDRVRCNGDFPGTITRVCEWEPTGRLVEVRLAAGTVCVDVGECKP